MPATEANATNYSVFAQMYDHVMAHIDYGRWASFLLQHQLKLKREKPRRILDAAAGTGPVVVELARKCKADFYLQDVSAEMLARVRAPRGARFYIRQASMVDLDYPEGFFDLQISTHDSLNYLTELGDLKAHLAAAFRVQEAGGLYMLDLTTEDNILSHFHNRTQEFVHQGWHLKWTNHYHPEERIITSALEFRDRKTGEIRVETHRQKFWHPDQFGALAQKAGFAVVAAYSDYSAEYRFPRGSLVNLILRK